MAERGTADLGREAGVPPLLPLARSWAFAGALVYGISLVVVYEVSADDALAVVATVLPLVLGAAIAVAFAAPLRRWSRRVQLVATVLGATCWSVLLFVDTDWSILTFALFALSFALGRLRGLAMAATLSLIWSAAIVADGEAGWALTGPIAALVVGAAVSLTLWSVADQNATQAELIAELQAAQHDLAIAEREKGVLEERARFAGEIHDTLAQGFTSIVLLSRTAQRTEHWGEHVAAIEETAQQNLEAARRLVAAIGPAELEQASLPDALRRQIDTTLDGETTGNLHVAGTPRPLGGAAEVTLLRTAQEALLNVRNHAAATTVHVTLSYVGDAVALDVQDDGVGFVGGTVTDRGSLTGGQGLRALGHRVESLGGELNLEAKEGGGTVLSVMLPVIAP